MRPITTVMIGAIAALSAQGAVAAAAAVDAADNTARPDYEIAVLGDSYSSGEGNPITPGQFDAQGALSPGGAKEDWGPTTEEERCHRSSLAASSLVAQRLQDEFPDLEINFRSFACSGAELGEGILEPHAGPDPEFNTGPKLDPQIDRLRRYLNNRDVRLDALLMTGGGNDSGFGVVVGACLFLDDCATFAPIDSYVDYRTQLTRVFGLALPGTVIGRYDDLASLLQPVSGAFLGDPEGFDDDRELDQAPRRVFVYEYPVGLTRTDGSVCHDEPSDDIFRQMAASEATFAQTVGTRMNTAVSSSANRHGFTFVSGTNAAFTGHGFCAAQPFLNANNLPLRSQGADVAGPFIFKPVPGILDQITVAVDPGIRLSAGIAHPNAAGHQAMADVMYPRVRSALVDHFTPGALTRPRITSTNRSGTTLTVRWQIDQPGFTGVATPFRPESITGFKVEVSGDDTRTVDATWDTGLATAHATLTARGALSVRVRSCTPVACGPLSPAINVQNGTVVAPVPPAGLRGPTEFVRRQLSAAQLAVFWNAVPNPNLGRYEVQLRTVLTSVTTTARTSTGQTVTIRPAPDLRPFRQVRVDDAGATGTVIGGTAQFASHEVQARSCLTNGQCSAWSPSVIIRSGGSLIAGAVGADLTADLITAGRARVGRVGLRPSQAAVAAGKRLPLGLTWRAPGRWRDLRTLFINVTRGRRTVARVVLSPVGGTVAVTDLVARRPPVPRGGTVTRGPARPVVLSGVIGSGPTISAGGVTIDLVDAVLGAAGPKGHDVSVVLPMRFARSLRGRLTLRIGGTARGNRRQPAVTAGTVIVG